MSKKLFVGNLSFDTQEAELRNLFSTVGTCTSVAIIIDRATSKSRGFGFVEMSTEEEAQRAASGLNGASLGGRSIRVNDADDKPAPRPAGAPRPARRFSEPDLPPANEFRKSGKSRRGLRGRKRSIY